KISYLLAQLRPRLRHFLLDAPLGLRDDISCPRLGIQLDIPANMLSRLSGLGKGFLRVAPRLIQERLDSLFGLGQISLGLIRVLSAFTNYVFALVQRLSEQRKRIARQHNQKDQKHEGLGQEHPEIDTHRRYRPLPPY